MAWNVFDTDARADETFERDCKFMKRNLSFEPISDEEFYELQELRQLQNAPENNVLINFWTGEEIP